MNRERSDDVHLVVEIEAAVTIAFVSWSAASAASATASKLSHCGQFAPKGLSAMEIGVKRRSPRPDAYSGVRGVSCSVTRAPADADSRCRAWPTAAPRGAPRESASRSSCKCRMCPPRSAATRRRSQRARARRSLERVVELAVVRVRRSVRQVIVVDGSSPDSSLIVPGCSSWMFSIAATMRPRSSMSSCESGSCLRSSSLLLSRGETQTPLHLGRTRCPTAPRSCPPACPETRRDRCAGNIECVGQQPHDRLVRPARSAAAATRTFHPSPCRPSTASRSAPGDTRNRRRVDTASCPFSVVPRPLPPPGSPATPRRPRARAQSAGATASGEPLRADGRGRSAHDA